MKKIIVNNTRLFVAILFVLVSTNFANAQQHGQQGPPPIPNDQQIEKMVTELSKELSLTDEQEEQVLDLYSAHFKEAGEMQDESKNSRPDREAMEQMRDDFETDVKALLTKDQQKQFDDYMKEKKSQRGGQKRSRN